METEAEHAKAAHAHYTLATLIVLGVVGTVAALAIAIGAMAITASRNSVDDALVTNKVDDYLAIAAPAAGLPGLGDVIPSGTQA